MKQFVVVITLLAVVAGGLSFECHKVGLYADQRSWDCEGYFGCGINEKTARRFTCPEGMRFSQRKMRCVAADTIFCNLQDVVSDFQCQTEGAQGEPDKSTGCWDTVVCLETRNGSLVGLFGRCQNCSCVLPDVEVDDQAVTFDCPDVGRFPDADSTDCASYNLCVRGVDDSLVRSKVTCPTKTLFSPDQRKCVADSNFQCPNELTTTTEPEPEHTTTSQVPDGSFNCPGVGRFPDAESLDCKDYVICSRNADGAFVQSKATCPPRTVFNPDTGRCVLAETYVCPSAVATTTTPSPPLNDCSEVGRFPDDKSPDCKKYFVCSQDVNGTLVQSSATCPPRTVFNSNTGRCVLADSYVCPSAGLTSTTASPALNGCSDVGRFPDESSLDCKKYFICSLDVNGTLVQSSATCPPRTVFNPDTGRCVLADSYVCPSAATTTSTPSTVPSPPLNDCSEVGRFPDKKSPDCKKYFVCSQNVNGTLVQSSATCPPRTVFNSETGRCVLETTYSCPKAPATTTPSTNEPNSLFLCQESGRFVDAESPDCKKYVICSKNAEGRLTSSSATCPPRTVFNGETRRCVLATTYACPRLTTTPTTVAPFSCPDVGRYPDRDSPDCRTYILCTLNGAGELLPNTRRCPPGNVFDVDAKRCVPEASYSCTRA